MSKYNTQALVDALLERGNQAKGDGYAYAAGYLTSVIENLSHNIKLNAKQEKALREYIEMHINSTKKMIKEG